MDPRFQVRCVEARGARSCGAVTRRLSIGPDTIDLRCCKNGIPLLRTLEASLLRTIFTFPAGLVNWARLRGDRHQSRRSDIRPARLPVTPHHFRDIRARPGSVRYLQKSGLRSGLVVPKPGSATMAAVMGIEPGLATAARATTEPPASLGRTARPRLTHIWKSAKGLDHDIPKWANAARTGATRTDFGDPF